MTKKNKNTSSAKKLIPAIAMLTTSAIMLTTSTYAWFTLNKEVEIRGLQMAAVAGDSLEITLGALDATVGGTKNNTTINNTDGKITTCGTFDNLGWCRAEAINSYYSVIGKLKPVSSATGNEMFKVDEEGVYAGGQAVEENTPVTLLNNTDTNNRNFMPVITLDNTYHVDDLTNGDDNENSKGYYVDIPIWIRSNNSDKTEANREVKAWVKITDPTKEGQDVTPNGSDLINAVRVAIIPVASTTNLKTSSEVDNLNYTQSAHYTVVSGGTTTVFALNQDTYASKGVLSGVGNDSKYGTATKTTPKIAQAADTFTTATTDEDATSFKATYDTNTDVPGTTIFTMPQAKNDDYAAVLVVARIWIEGESIYCNDATANQDWSIDFHFEFADSTTT